MGHQVAYSIYGLAKCRGVFQANDVDIDCAQGFPVMNYMYRLQQTLHKRKITQLPSFGPGC